jgi:hypothetical protein
MSEGTFSKFTNWLKKHLFKVVFISFLVLVTGLFLFKEEIKKNKIVKTKMEILKTMQTKEVKEWKGGIEHAIDSILVEKDSLSD